MPHYTHAAYHQACVIVGELPDIRVVRMLVSSAAIIAFFRALRHTQAPPPCTSLLLQGRCQRTVQVPACGIHHMPHLIQDALGLLLVLCVPLRALTHTPLFQAVGIGGVNAQTALAYLVLEIS